MLSPSAATCLATVLLMTSCGSGGGASAVVGSAGFSEGQPVALDATLRVTFGGTLDPASLTPAAVELVAVEGPGVGVPARGRWRTRGSALEFVPGLALEPPVATNGGLRAASRYELRVRGAEWPDGLRTLGGRPVTSATFSFRTRDGEGPEQLFDGNRPGGPRVLAAVASPLDDSSAWRLGRAFATPTLRLEFDQPLFPDEANLPREPGAAAPGAIRLTWDDPVYGAATPVPLHLVLVQNDAEGAVVELRPRGVLPSDAVLELRVLEVLRDIHGEQNVGAAAEPVRTVRTEADDLPRSDALRFEVTADQLGPADFAEAPAVVQDGALVVVDSFPAVDPDVGDWAPLSIDTVLRTDSQQLVYQNGVAKTFSGGVLPMRNLHVPPGFVVRAHGPDPLVLVVDGDALIEGVLSVDGSDAPERNQGQYRGPGDVTPPTTQPGGGQPAGPIGASGGPAAGHGGTAYGFLSSLPSVAGGSAEGVVDGGGGGGIATCDYQVQASGGGGGGGAVRGDPWFPLDPGATLPFPQVAGEGGRGAGTGMVGGAAGQPWFQNADPADDFWGRAFEPRRGRQISGELSAPRGGSGGGSGGGWGTCENALYLPGGGGGGGGGVLILQVRGRLTITASGRVSADGGDGTGGTDIFWLGRGCGGGGAGGSVVLMAGGGITLHTHGETFANRDYDFGISADGGVCVTGPSGMPPTVRAKYPANGDPVIQASQYTLAPLGGFGGMGLVQLMVPVGHDNTDGTNTVLDDAIEVVRNGVPLVGQEKQRFLGWRGFPDENGVLVDDFGMPTGTIGGQGDIRPDPVLLPVPWASDGRARARSRWLPLGALHRRAITAPDGLPRGVVGDATTFGAHARSDGWLPFGEGRLSEQSGGVELLAGPATIVAVAADVASLDRPAVALTLAADLPDTAPGSYTGCIADCGDAEGGSWARVRVLHSTARTLLVEGDAAAFVGVSRVRLLGWFAELASPEPGSYVGFDGTVLPRANVRIGFAFHRAPDAAATSGVDPDRYPAQVGAFVHDLRDPATRAALRAFGPRAVMWDVLLDEAWQARPWDAPPSPGPDSRVALRRFFVPVRY